jgi:hypothetical protein
MECGGNCLSVGEGEKDYHVILIDEVAASWRPRRLVVRPTVQLVDGYCWLVAVGTVFGLCIRP